ncbi:MAG TPA: hypothetical protein VEM93_08875, partial [Actinomycetota bacterium]|nr:hypothetical protein [Actinomycetota bacterium]
MLRRRASAVFATLAVLATALAAVPPSPASAGGHRPSSAGSAASGLLGTELKGVGLLDNFTGRGSNLVRLLAGVFDPTRDALPDQSGIPLVLERTLPVGVAQYWLAQVKDERYPEVNDAVRAAGAAIVGIVPDATYMVRATPEQRDRIAASSGVRWIGYYQPAWRIPVAAGEKPALMS